VQDDLAIMIEGADGRYYFQAGAICVAGSWRLADKIGLCLEEIHVSGHVPEYREKLLPSLDKFFPRLKLDGPVQRSNYTIQVVDPDEDPLHELAWAESTLGPEDNLEHGTSSAQRPEVTAGALRLRTERQTLRRLKVTGAIVFTIRSYLTRLDELGREERARLACAVRGWGEEVQRYKGGSLFMGSLLEQLDLDPN